MFKKHSSHRGEKEKEMGYPFIPLYIIFKIFKKTKNKTKTATMKQKQKQN